MNPYTSRAMIKDPSGFYGRAAELHDLYTLLAGMQSCSVVGPRRIGKSSLLYHLVRPATYAAHLPDAAPYVFAFVDLQELAGLGPEDFFFTAVERLLRASGGRLEANPERDGTQAGFRRFLARTTDAGLRLVLCCDEFEMLSRNPGFGADFFTYLRGLCSNYQLALVTSSQASLFDLCHQGNLQTSQFWNIFVERTLGLMPEGEARQLIREPARGAARAFSPATEDFIYALVGGHPMGAQIACFHAFETGGDIVEIEKRTMHDLGVHLQYYWDSLAPAEQAALRNFADAAARESTDTTMRGLLRSLVQKCVLVAEAGSYRYPSRAWTNFLADQLPAAPTAPKIMGLPAGARLGPYEVLEPLGRGGMAEVYKGRHTRLGRSVAIKILPESLASEADFRQRFEREAQAVAALKHPNIVQVFDFGDVDGMYYMVMEYLAGKDLAHLMRETGPLPLAQARAVARDVASALDYAHAQGLVHRDVKPSNVMLEVVTRDEGRKTDDRISPSSLVLDPSSREAFRAILTDFGIVKIVAGSTGATKTAMMGTLDYMAPEQIQSATGVDARADVYALGVMLYEMLTGQLPFAGSSAGAVVLAHLQQPAPDPRALAASLPENVALAILRALAKDPADRPLTAGELAAALG